MPPRDIAFLVILAMLYESGGVEGLATCKSTKLQVEYGIILHWSETPVGETRPSIPLCVDKDDAVLQRRCNEAGIWEEFEPQRCTFFALKQFFTCPYGMQKLHLGTGDICVLLTEATKWQNQCFDYGGTKNLLDLSGEQLQNVVNHLRLVKNLSEIWLPARRYQDFNPYQWQTLGTQWGNVVDFDDYKLELDDNYKDKCVKLVITTEKLALKSENCEKLIPEFCVYGGQSSVGQACKSGLTSRYFYHQDKCFSVEKSYDPKKALFKATNLISRRFIKGLLESYDIGKDDRCLVDLTAVGYSFRNTSYGQYSVINGDGKWSLSQFYTCVVYEENVVAQKPEIHLKYDATAGKMFLITYSEDFLWKKDEDDRGVKCFTIADNQLIKVAKIKKRLWSEKIQRYEARLFDSKKTFEITKTIYELTLYGHGPRIYWCKGHAIKSAELVYSKSVVARKKSDGVVFALLLATKVKKSNGEIYTEDFLDKLTKKLQRIVKASEKLSYFERIIVSTITDVRVMKIVNFDKTTSELTAIYHITFVKPESDSNEEYDDFMEKYADDVKVLVNHHLMSFMEEIFSKIGKAEFRFISINSTEYCLPTAIKNPNPLIAELTWDQANIGETLPPNDLCVYESGIPLTRKCEGDFLQGGRWENLSDDQLQCVNKEILTLYTKRLFSFNKVLDPNETKGVIENITSISSHYDQLIAADLFYISKAVQQITSAADVSQSASDNLNSMDLDDKYNLTIILNNIMNVNDSLIKLSQLKLNTTNILLDSYDNLINSLSTNYSIYSTINNLISNSLNETDGTFVMRTEKIFVFICDPARMNVSGMALVKDRSVTETSLLDFRVEKLYSTQTIDDILNIYQDSLEVASFFPQKLIDRIDEIHNLETNTTIDVPLKIVIKVYYNDAMFKESSPVSSLKSQSKIISVDIPGHDQNLPLLLPIMFKKSSNTQQTDDDVCGYWEFQPNGSTSDSSEWLSEGCEFMGASKYNESLALCGCSHLSHFAYLYTGTFIHDIQPEDYVRITKSNAHSKALGRHWKALNTITLLGSTLSILGIIGIFVTALFFKAWREKSSTKVLLQLSLAIALQMVLFIFFSTEKHTYTIETDSEKRACIALGSSLHYSVLVTFSWMLIAAFLQFKRYVIVIGNLKPERFFLKSFFFGWGLPVIPVAVVLLIDPYLYIPEIYGICYPQGLAFYFSVLLPVGLIVVANLIVFVLVIYSILKVGWNESNRKNEQSITISQLRVSIFLFFLLGLTWIFGFLASSQTTIIFSYLFCLTASIQGFVLFLYFILMDPITRRLWHESLRSWKPRN